MSILPQPDMHPDWRAWAKVLLIALEADLTAQRAEMAELRRRIELLEVP